MWNRRNIGIVVITMAAVGIVTAIILSYLYNGFTFEGTVRAGKSEKSAYYTFEIDKALDVNDYKNKTPLMGVALEWENPAAKLKVDIYKVEGRKEILLGKWRENPAKEKGYFAVQPGETYRIAVTTKTGESKYLLKVFKPGETYSSADEYDQNQIEGLAFFRIKENEANTIYTCKGRSQNVQFLDAIEAEDEKKLQ